MPPLHAAITDAVCIKIVLYAVMFFTLIQSAVTAFATPLYRHQEYHTSALSGHAWVQELLNGHPERIRTELGMRKEVFESLVLQLSLVAGLKDSCYVTLEEQIAIFLYIYSRDQNIMVTASFGAVRSTNAVMWPEIDVT
ncbi:unnamed protein product [Mycena citricolor]|uniref:DUF8040 domain-containing protein n=1 Tax=Mycena citricolor TaxID=2018698 RepID=A0AAD2GTK2_9AGAR|nr:unnamed protein product [Mycena citricolor]